MEIDTENGLVDTVAEGKSGMNRESSTDIYTLVLSHSVVSDSLQPHRL